MSVKTANIIAILVLTALGLAVLANSMSKPVGRDEQMYCTAGVLMAQGKMIYRDFSYAAQMPYHALLYAALFKTLSTSYYLLTGRIVSVVCDILVVVCIVFVYRRIFATFAASGMLLGLAGGILYVFNPLVDYANGYAWNHDVVILCVVLSFLLFLSCDLKQKSRYWRIAAIGVLLTLAACMRITTALVELMFFVLLLLQPAKSRRERLISALPFLIGATIVLIWPVWVIALSGRAFVLNLVHIPMLYGEWLRKIGMVHDKLELTWACLSRPGYLVLFVIAIYLALTVVCLRRKLKMSRGKSLLLVALLSVAFSVIAYIPPTMWRQYLAMPVPFGIMSFAYPLLWLRKLSDNAGHNKHFNIASVSVAVCAFIAVVSYPAVLYRTPVLLIQQTWIPVQMHRVSRDIAENTEEPRLILTLAPLYALEGGCDIYTELSAGSIIYRIADLMSPSERALTHTAGLETLKEIVSKSPPSAVIVGTEPRYFSFLEEPLAETALEAQPDNWERKVYDQGPVVYFRHLSAETTAQH
jgi:hypothetical protein